MHRARLVALLVAAPVALAGLLVPGAASAADDTAPPTVESLTITPATVDVSAGPGPVTFRVHLIDETGVQSGVFINLEHVPSGQQRFVHPQLVEGTATDGVWEVQTTMPTTAARGTWTATSYQQDVHGNLGASGEHSFDVVADTPTDQDPPQVFELEVTPRVVDVSTGGGRVTLRARITDVSGLTRLVTRAAPRYQFGNDFPTATRISGDQFDGVYEAGFDVPQGATRGAWDFGLFALQDAHGNQTRTFFDGTFDVAVPPDAPTDVTATRGDGSALVSWAPPADNGSGITGYTVTVAPGGRTVPVPAGSGQVQVDGLTNGSDYTFAVTAANGAGTGASSAPSSVVTPAGVPAAPPRPQATASDGGATVTFEASPDANGSPVTGYTVTASPGGANVTVGSGVRSAVLTGLPNGTEHTFTVAATNDVGTSAPSAPSLAVTPAGLPGAPPAPRVQRGDDSVEVAWDAPDTNGSPIVSYTVVASPGGGTTVVTGGRSVVVPVRNGVASTFTVAATNGVGTGPASAASDEVTPAGRPAAPPKPTVTRGDRAAVVDFQPSTDANGSPVTGYTVTASPGGASETVAAGARTATIAGLTNGTDYTFTVTATNDVGDSDASPASETVTPADRPAAPPKPTAARADGEAVVTFEPSAADHGAPVSGYTVTASPGGATAEVAAGARSATVEGLTNGTAYTFTVTATNDVGDSDASPASESVTPAGRPGEVGTPTVVLGERSATVSWRPADPRGSSITGYTVTATPGGAVRHVDGSATSVRFDGLETGVAYTFVVTASNGIGAGPGSDPSPTARTGDVPGATRLTARRGDRALTLSWSAARVDGIPVTGYLVSCAGLPDRWLAAGARSVTVRGLTNGRTYRCAVRARNSLGLGPVSSSVSVVPAGRPGRLARPTARIAGSKVRVSWKAPGANGARITGYVVRASNGVTRRLPATARSVTFRGLEPGRYTFRVRAVNEVGRSRAGVLKRVTVTDPPSYSFVG